MAARVARAACHAHDLCPRYAGGGHCRQGFAFVFGFSACFDPFLIFIALFVYIGASQGSGPGADERCLTAISSLQRDGAGVSHTPENASLQEAVDALLATSQHDFPVVDETAASPVC